MSRRIEVLSSKLPEDVLVKIEAYDSHPTANLIRSLDFLDVGATTMNPPRELITSCPSCFFLPVVYQMMHRKRRSQNRHLTGHLFLPIPWRTAQLDAEF